MTEPTLFFWDMHDLWSSLKDRIHSTAFTDAMNMYLRVYAEPENSIDFREVSPNTFHDKSIDPILTCECVEWWLVENDCVETAAIWVPALLGRRDLWMVQIDGHCVASTAPVPVGTQIQPFKYGTRHELHMLHSKNVIEMYDLYMFEPQRGIVTLCLTVDDALSNLLW